MDDYIRQSHYAIIKLCISSIATHNKMKLTLKSLYNQWIDLKGGFYHES